MAFIRPEHVLIADALASMDAAWLQRMGCYFGGGTAIVLQNGEYRRSLDIDFLCASADGYRELRMVAVEQGVRGFFGDSAQALKPLCADQYGLRTMLEWRGQAIKFEIVRGARIALAGAIDPTLGVPTLDRVDQFAEKLLANADRGLDRAFGYRDAIDLGFLTIGSAGIIPPQSIAKAALAYGEDIARKVQKVITALADEAKMRHAANTLAMNCDDAQRAAAALRRAGSNAWPSVKFAEISAP